MFLLVQVAVIHARGCERTCQATKGVTPDYAETRCCRIAPDHRIAPHNRSAAQESAIEYDVSPNHGVAPNDGIAPNYREIADDRDTAAGRIEYGARRQSRPRDQIGVRQGGVDIEI